MEVNFLVTGTYRRKLALAKRVTTSAIPKSDALCINTPDTTQHPQDYLVEAHYYNTNTVDPDFDIDSSAEFDDSTELDNPDAQFNGLTIVSMGKDTRRWLKGYNIL